MGNDRPSRIAVIGAGPAGLAVAYELARRGIACWVFDKNKEVGGLARTVNYKGYFFDLGPHRFFTKNEEINNFWQELLGKDLIKVKRLTRIYYQGRFFYYPIRVFNVFSGLGPATSSAVFLSYLKSQLKFFGREPANFEEWLIKNFGESLYRIFFKTYTEKVWGIPCREIGPEWASQRIKNLNFWQAVKNALLKNNGQEVKSLVNQFSYPRKGAGMLYDRMRAAIEGSSRQIFLESPVHKIYHQAGQIKALEVSKNSQPERVAVDYLFSSAPITFFVQALEPKPPRPILEAALQLRYRDHITVNLIVNRPRLFPDQWLYIHSPEMKMARVTNYANFSEAMTADPQKTPLAVEYFVFADRDELWQMADDELIALAGKELNQLGLVRPSEVIDGFVVREKDSYPTYYLGHRQPFEILKNYTAQFSNLQLVGRAGMYKYNNQDHALLTGFLAARNFLGEANDLWSVNADAEYLENKSKL